jgi:uncharacterized MAPEG superfamily protein
MAIAYWCVLVAAFLPYAWVAIAKSGGRRYDNRSPREWLARQEDARVRHAHAAHLNAFEAFAPFAAGVLMSQFAGVAEAIVAMLAVAFVAFRILHGLFYLSGRHLLRSAAWTGGFLCVLGLMALAAVSIATSD